MIEKIREHLPEAVACANFMQKMKLKWWQGDNPKIAEPILDDLFMLCFEEITTHEQKAKKEAVGEIEAELRRLEDNAESDAEHCSCLGHAIWLLFEATEEERKSYWKSYEKELK